MSTWLITGASSGFGKLVAERAADEGHTVLAVARRADRLAELAQRPGIVPLTLDLTAPAAEDALRTAIDEAGGVDVLINNAGYGLFGALEDTPDRTARDIFDVNFFAALTVLRAALPSLRAASGRIVQVSSLLGQAVWPSSSLYSASKAALELASEALAVELEHTGVRVTIVEPGIFRTEFGTSSVTLEHSEAYDATIGKFREWVATLDPETLGDPAEFVDAVFEVVEAQDPPLRRPVGAEAVDRIREAMQQRIAGIAA